MDDDEQEDKDNGCLCEHNPAHVPRALLSLAQPFYVPVARVVIIVARDVREQLVLLLRGHHRVR